MDRGAWWAIVQGVAKSRTQLRNFTFTWGVRLRVHFSYYVFLKQNSHRVFYSHFPSHNDGWNRSINETSFHPLAPRASRLVQLLLKPDLLSTLNSLLYPLSLSPETFSLSLSLSLSLSHLFSRSIKCSAFSSVNKIYSSCLVISWLLQRPVSSGHKFLMQLLCAPSPWRLNSFYDITVGTETLPGSAETERHKSSGRNPLSQTPTPSGKWSFFRTPREL